MANVKKYDKHALVNLLRHNERTVENPSNEDIDSNKSHLNYSLAPDRGMSSFDYFKQRKSELYCYNRADVKVVASWVVTAPRDLPAEQHRAFFESVNRFLMNRYKEENCIQSIVHLDESGQSHLHYVWVPSVPDKKHGGEKICCNDVLTRRELRNFHPELQKHLQADGICARVMSGITAVQGNRTVREMKQERQWQHEHERTLERGRW